MTLAYFARIRVGAIMLALVVTLALLPTASWAVGAALCDMIYGVMSSGLARAIATIGVLMVGVGATLGKVSWTLALTVAVGIAAMFGVSSILAGLTPLTPAPVAGSPAPLIGCF